MSAETFADLIAALGAFRTDCLGGEPSNRAIARAVGVSPQTVTNWFAGKHFPGQDAGAPVKMVRMIKASAGEQGIAAPEGLLDVDRWREAHRAEAARRQGRTSDAAVRTRAQRAAAPGLFLDEAADPFVFEVHRPVKAQAAYSGLPSLPPYVRREHDEELAEVSSAARDGRSGIAVLVGGSSTGKTRACWETLKTLTTPDIRNGSWRLWHPLEPSPAKAASQALPLVAPRTVIWLNEAQRYLGAC
jgi:AcrR family transcriptional regulator